MTIWFATGNAHKKAELAAILNVREEGYRLLIPADVGLEFDPEETESTFSGNAILKANALYELLNQHRSEECGFETGDMIIADDSGICVDALGGRPGIFSARYAGADSGAENRPNAKKLQAAQRNALLLEELGDNPHRSARFVCAMVLLFSPDRFFLAQETFEGEIVAGPEAIKGTGGFGYDPIFYLPYRGCTSAELSEDEKNTLSHRAKAGKIITTMVKAYSRCQNST
jgi:XTP/dITP diphosphohydrolase